MKISDTKDLTEQGKFRFLIYGGSGAGKTKLISTIPGRALVLDTDKGMQTLRGIEGVKYVTATSWPEIKEFLEFIDTDKAKKDFDWIVFDTLTVILDKKLSDLSDRSAISDKPDSRKVWGDYAEYALKFLSRLRDQKDYNILVLSQMNEKEDSNGISLKGPSVAGSARNRVAEFFDEVFVIKEDKEGVRALQTASFGGFMAKDRSQALEKNEKADLSLIMNKIKEGVKNVKK